MDEEWLKNMKADKVAELLKTKDLYTLCREQKLSFYQLESLVIKYMEDYVEWLGDSARSTATLEF